MSKVPPIPPMPKVEIEGCVRIDAYRVIEDAVERGIRWGWQHAHKYVDDPGEAGIKTAIGNDVMNELCEVLRFGDE